MVAKLAYRNLFHDRLSLVVTLVGIVFSVVLIAVQFGLYIGSEVRIAAMLDQTRGDLWVVPYGTKSFDDPTFLEGQVKHAVLSTPGIASVEELVAGFVAWRRPDGGTTAALLVGSDTTTNKSLPWDIVEGSIRDLSAPSAVAVDRTYFEELGIKGIGDRAEINGNAGDGHGRHRQHPLLHHAALHLHHPRHGAHAARHVARPVLLRGRQGRAGQRHRGRAQGADDAAAPSSPGRRRMRRSSPTRSSASAASTAGCSRRAPARPSSPARRSA